MITPSDRHYRQTKRIKAGENSLKPPFRELGSWIADQYGGVTVLNIYYDRIIPGRRPRLNVVLQREHERQKFLTGPRGDYDPVAQARIASQFTQIIAEQKNTKVDTHNLFVVFAAFEPVARVEANWKVTKEQLTQLQTALDDPTIWLIRPSWDNVVFFFYTDAQLRASEGSALRTRCGESYSQLLSRYDEFGYFREQPISVFFDSKENFDTKYQSNWHYYDR
jgi:hypothetical protein